MTKSASRQWKPRWEWAMVFVLAFSASLAAKPPARSCRRVELEGQVSAAQEWKAVLGQGWVFRVLPIAPSAAGYSGWDLVVDRDPPAGYPDALLLATFPYNSINEREIGTTFGLRAQDAIGWNPRSFRFLSDAAKFRQAQESFRALQPGGPGPAGNGAPSAGNDALRRLLEFQKDTSSGEFRILDAHIVPGIADPQPFAQQWAVGASRTRHEIEASAPAQATAQGRLVWMRFAVTLWFPLRWTIPPEIHGVHSACPEQSM